MQRIETRRTVLALGAGLGAALLARPSLAVADPLANAIAALTNHAEIKPGKVRIHVPPLVENGNSVQLSVTVDNPMTRDNHVTMIALFNEKNPQPEVAVFQIGPRAGQARISTRIRLATSQKLIAIAKLNDGTFWSESAEVIVTIAACTEEL